MNIEDFRYHCINKPAAKEDFPFDSTTLAFKVFGKIFALTNLSNVSFRINLKCNPEKALILREEYPGIVIPGYHMNKKHWNTIYPEKDIPDELVYNLIDHSYDLVVSNLPKRDKLKLGII